MSNRTANNIALLGVMLAAWLWLNGGGSLLPSSRVIDVEGVAVLIVEESSDRSKLPIEQLNIVTGAKWQALVPAGNWRVWDKDVTPTEPFVAAFSRPRTSLPWCLIDGGVDYEGPLPGTLAEFVAKVEAAK
jgi:hypothetical protein